MTLPEAIRSIRKSRHMNTTEMGLSLGVSQSVISRYEKRLRTPRRPVLLKLLLLAEGEEKRAILRELNSGTGGEQLTESEALQEASKASQYDSFVRAAVDFINQPEEARFSYLSAVIMQDRIPVDESLNTILSCWINHRTDPDAVRYFRDAARFLEIAFPSDPAETKALIEKILQPRTGT